MLAAAIRKAVSQDRLRFNDGKHDLDLSYITDHIIAMAIPGSGIETYWRNDIDTVASMLDTYHKGKYMIWNLSELTYNYDKFDHMVIDVGFPDHHNPPLDLLFQIVVTMEKWISADENHVAVVHCKGGKGRTGTVIACYLLFSGVSTEPFDALELFAKKRSSKLKGVTGASQLRYVSYFGAVLNARKKPVPRKFRLKRIVMSSIPMIKKGSNQNGKRGCRPILLIYRSDGMIPLLTRQNQQTRLYCIEETNPIVWEFEDLYTEGDILIQCRHFNKDFSADRIVFRIGFHTAFVEEGELVLGMSELDDVNKNRGRFRDDFCVHLFFEAVGGSTKGKMTQGGEGFSFNSSDCKDEEMDDKTAIYMQAFQRAPANRITFSKVQHFLKKGMLPPGLPPGMALGIIAPPPSQPFSSSQSRPSASLSSPLRPTPTSPSTTHRTPQASSLTLPSPQRKVLPPPASSSTSTPTLSLTPPSPHLTINSQTNYGRPQHFSPHLPPNRGEREREREGEGDETRKNISVSPPVSRPPRQVVRPPRSTTPSSTRPGGGGDGEEEAEKEKEKMAPAMLSAMKGSKQFYSMNQMPSAGPSTPNSFTNRPAPSIHAQRLRHSLSSYREENQNPMKTPDLGADLKPLGKEEIGGEEDDEESYHELDEKKEESELRVSDERKEESELKMSARRPLPPVPKDVRSLQSPHDVRSKRTVSNVDVTPPCEEDLRILRSESNKEMWGLVEKEQAMERFEGEMGREGGEAIPLRPPRKKKRAIIMND